MSILMASPVVQWAEECVHELLGDLRPRIDHVLAVGEKARRISTAFNGADAELLVAAAYLHDIGYAPAVVDTGLHQIDGARWLRSQGQEQLAGLVAHHTAAHFELRLRGQHKLLRSYPRPPHALAAALAYCDITTGPQGQDVTLEERIAEVGHRRGRDSVVYRALVAARPELEGAVAHTCARLGRVLSADPWGLKAVVMTAEGREGSASRATAPVRAIPGDAWSRCADTGWVAIAGRETTPARAEEEANA